MRILIYLIIFLFAETAAAQKINDQTPYQIYSSIDFSNSTFLSCEVFENAYRGFQKMKADSLIRPDCQIITICDFNLPSFIERMWVIDLSKKKVLYNTLVAHGQNSGDLIPERFSNSFNSHQSSIGFYVTGDTYRGKYGTQLRLDGKDTGFNSNALDRGIVIHGSKYVSRDFVNRSGKLGKSWGCPAVSYSVVNPIIQIIKGGTCLFIWFNDRKYRDASKWLKD